MWDWLDGLDFGDIGQRALSWAGDSLSSIPQQLLSADFLLPALLSGGGMYMQNKALKDAQKRQQDVINQSMADTSAMQVPVSNAVNQMSFERSTPQVEQETTALQRQIGAGLDDYLTKAREVMPAEARSGRLSTDYTSGMATMSAEEAARRKRLNEAFASLSAPTQQQFEQGVRDTGYGTTINNANADSMTLARDAALKAEKAGQPSGGQLTLGQLLSTGGGALASNALLKPKTSTFDFSKAAKNMWDVSGGI